MPYLEREGIFLAKPIDHGTKHGNEKSEQFNIQFEVTASYDRQTKQWSACVGEPRHCSARINMVTKAGVVNKIGVKQLVEAFGWDGDINKLNGDWDMPECQIRVGSRTYDNKPYYDAEQVMARESDPEAQHGSGVKKDDPTEATQRLEQHAGAMRALVGSGPTAASAPAVPAQSPTETATPPTDTEMPPPREPEAPTGSSIPF